MTNQNWGDVICDGSNWSVLNYKCALLTSTTVHSSCPQARYVGMLTWPMRVVGGQWRHGNSFSRSPEFQVFSVVSAVVSCPAGKSDFSGRLGWARDHQHRGRGPIVSLAWVGSTVCWCEAGVKGLAIGSLTLRTWLCAGLDPIPRV